MGMFPWTAVLALAFPQPLAHAVWVHGALLAGAVAATGRRLRMSEQLCPQAGGQYSRAMWVLGMLGAAVLPTPLLSAVLAWEPDSARAFAVLSFALHVCCTFVLPLYLLFHQQRRLREDFACQQGWAAELAKLRERR